jgi:hypothetical protein
MKSKALNIKEHHTCRWVCYFAKILEYWFKCWWILNGEVNLGFVNEINSDKVKQNGKGRIDEERSAPEDALFASKEFSIWQMY